jgi:hypothetical protein
MIKQLLILAFVFGMVVACAANEYQDYKPGIVISAVEYDGKPHSLGCKGEFKCDKETIECVYHFHEETQNHIDMAKDLIKSGSEKIPVTIEFYNALCNLYQVKTHLGILEKENKNDWEILEKTGLIKQTDLIALILAVKIRELELEEKRGDCNETSSCPGAGF